MSDLLQNTHIEPQKFAELTHQLFLRLDPQDVEQFYASYHSWALQQRIEHLRKRIYTLQHQIAENTELLQLVSPSPIAHAALALLQAHGVDDVDLLDRMLERGDTWLDHTLQLLEQCERLHLIQSTYTQWCERALEGAYNWVESIDVPAHMPSSDEDSLNVADTEQVMPMSEVTEEQLLQKLMSEDETEKYPAIRFATPSPKITRPLVETTNGMTNMQPTSPEIIVAEEASPAPITLIEVEISAHHIAEAPVAIPKKEVPIVTNRETNNKPQQRHNWLQRLLTTIWQAIP